MRKAKSYIQDKYHREIIRIELFFTINPEKRKSLWVAYEMWSKEGRKLLAEAMLEGVRKELEKDIKYAQL